MNGLYELDDLIEGDPETDGFCADLIALGILDD